MMKNLFRDSGTVISYQHDVSTKFTVNSYILTLTGLTKNSCDCLPCFLRQLKTVAFAVTFDQAKTLMDDCSEALNDMRSTSWMQSHSFSD